MPIEIDAIMAKAKSPLDAAGEQAAGSLALGDLGGPIKSQSDIHPCLSGLPLQ